MVFPFEIQTDSCLSSGWWLPMLRGELEIRLILKSQGKVIVHLLITFHITVRNEKNAFYLSHLYQSLWKPCAMRV